MNPSADISELMELNKEGVSMQKIAIGTEAFFKISNHHLMRPFMMNVVSDSNHWMFLMSNGGMTAGRKNAEYALFPYYTDDKLAEFADLTGSKTIFQISDGLKTQVWEPFSERFTGKYAISRNLYKNLSGNKVIFEEINNDLGLSFSYEWNSSNLYGFVKKSKLRNLSDNEYRIKVLDGIQNIMPHGVGSALQNSTSNLVDAYKRNELHQASGMGIFSLSAHIVDKAEPSESLKANVAWYVGIQPELFLLSSLQLNKFRFLENIQNESDVKGEKGAYFIQASMVLKAGGTSNWQLVANVNQDAADIQRLIEFIQKSERVVEELQKDIDKGTFLLNKTIAEADGIQYTADALKDARHFSNVLFNVLRGGIFDNQYQIEKTDLIRYFRKANHKLILKHESFFNQLNEVFSKHELDLKLAAENDADLTRLAKEYLPLRFSRRHGDPSRPWNKFTINTHNENDGSKILDYEGNWRDIFQNWEALAYSYPDFIEGMILKFLNASTFDGYNPYRINKDGFDWETIEPDNPWSYIGYWGDHQVIYLLKFLEFAQQTNKTLLPSLFDKDLFVYANVPYKIKPYSDLILDSKNTIEFDEHQDLEIRRKVQEYGSDASLLGSKKDEIYQVNFIEKILAVVLAKTSNFIPEGGIWMNTQRPEWNDANNALVGNGISMVTLCYLYRFLHFFGQIIEGRESNQVLVSNELFQLFNRISEALESQQELLETGFTNKQRKQVSDALGIAGSKYRELIYKQGFSGNKSILELNKIQKFIQTANRYFEQSIRVNKRKDKLYNAYNLLSIREDSFEISYLSEMLEGQVAAISSGLLSPDEVVSLLDEIRKSPLYRADQNSYLLYPNKSLPGFLEKNIIQATEIEKSELLKKLIQENNRNIVVEDVAGIFHFNGNFHNAEDLKKALADLESGSHANLVKQERTLILEIFENTFNHKSFTGRSGTFFAYEGLGSIYWHMVSKLYLAVQEVCVKASMENTSAGTLENLFRNFRLIGDGIGVHKSPQVYGAFPTDAYSHTPLHRGAQQPGMTGQVKEDILVRMAELGLRIENGSIRFDPVLLQKTDFIEETTPVDFIGIQQNPTTLKLQKGMLAFSLCQVPICYHLADKQNIEVHFRNGKSETIDGLNLPESYSRSLFERRNEIEKIEVQFSQNDLKG